jgi:(N-acetylneuraminyl)-galactosylglucosylceramide N-acetylgalactosaminyltransferase
VERVPLPVAFGVKTFERPHLLRRLLDSLFAYYPAASVYVADDSQRPADLTEWSSVVSVPLPYDAGLSAGRNAIIDRSHEPLLLFLDDDFIFTADTRVERFVAFLDVHPWCGIVTGTTVVNGVPERYEGTFAIEDGGRRLRLVPLDNVPAAGGYAEVHYGINFLLARREVFGLARWDPALKLSEHLPFFLAAHHAGVRIAYLPEVRINHGKEATRSQYMSYRSRAPFFLLRFMEKAGFHHLVNHAGVHVRR